MTAHQLGSFSLGSMIARYGRDQSSGCVGLLLLPAPLRSKVCVRHAQLHGVEIDGFAAASGLSFPAWTLDSLVQVKVSGDSSPAGFAQGRTLRHSGTIERLTFRGQQVTRNRKEVCIRTTLQHADGWLVHHHLVWKRGASWLESWVAIENTSSASITLELLSSFSIGGITPFATDDRICVLKDGRIMQVDEPIKLYNRPDNLYVAGFIGSPAMNLVRGTLIAAGLRLCFRESGQAFDLELPLALSRAAQAHVGQGVVLGIRPEDIAEIDRDACSSHVELKLDLAEPMGAETYLYLRGGNSEVIARVPPRDDYVPGQMVRLAFDLDKLHLFDAKTELAIR